MHADLHTLWALHAMTCWRRIFSIYRFLEEEEKEKEEEEEEEEGEEKEEEEDALTITRYE